MNFISSSLLVTSSTEMTVENLIVWKKPWRSAVQGDGVHPQGDSTLRKHAERHLEHGHTLFSTWKCPHSGWLPPPPRMGRVWLLSGDPRKLVDRSSVG